MTRWVVSEVHIFLDFLVVQENNSDGKKLRSTYHIHAIQWAIKANVAINKRSTAAPYSLYLSIFRATLTKRRSLAVFNKPMRVVVWKKSKTIHYENSFRNKSQADLLDIFFAMNKFWSKLDRSCSYASTTLWM